MSESPKTINVSNEAACAGKVTRRQDTDAFPNGPGFERLYNAVVASAPIRDNPHPQPPQITRPGKYAVSADTVALADAMRLLTTAEGTISSMAKQLVEGRDIAQGAMNEVERLNSHMHQARQFIQGQADVIESMKLGAAALGELNREQGEQIAALGAKITKLNRRVRRRRTSFKLKSKK